MGKNTILVTIVSLMSLSLNAFASVQKAAIEPTAAKIEWSATKKIGSGHTGTIALKTGEVQIDNGVITGGNLVIDMNTIAVTDIPATEKDNAKLKGHLVSDDFFAVKKNPEAKLVIKTSKVTTPGKLEVTGDLTIKGKTLPITFPVEMKTEAGKMVATGKLSVDRTKYGIRYGSGNFFKLPADRIINDTFELTFNVTATPATGTGG